MATGGGVESSGAGVPRSVDDRTDLAHTRARQQLGRGLHDGVEKGPGVADEDERGGSHASLAGRAECRGEDVVDHHLLVAVGQRDEVVLRPAERQHALVDRAAALRDDLGNAGGADEGDSVDTGVVAEGLDHGDGAVDHLQHALCSGPGVSARAKEGTGGRSHRGKAGAHGQLDDAVHGHRDLLARLEDDAVAGAQRDGGGP